jgi:hypothetical protein
MALDYHAEMGELANEMASVPSTWCVNGPPVTPAAVSADTQATAHAQALAAAAAAAGVTKGNF